MGPLTSPWRISENDSRLSQSKSCWRGAVPKGEPLFGVKSRIELTCCRAIIITTSSRKDRLERYLASGDIHLTDEDIDAIDKAGKKGEKDKAMRDVAMAAAKYLALAGVGFWAAAKLVL